MNHWQTESSHLAHRRRLRRRRRMVGGGAIALVAVIAAAVAVAASSGGSSSSKAGASATHAARSANVNTGPSGHSSGGSAATSPASGQPGTAAVPVLMYHVIAPPPAGAPFPGLYVPPDQLAAQMQALKAAGWHAVTLDQVAAYWSRGASLGPGKPVVITFDNGYRSQYESALPVLQRLGWVGDENIQLTGLPPSQGGMTDTQLRGLISAGWELDTQGMSHADLVALGPSQLHYEVTTARQLLRQRYGVPVNWFCYPSGHYNATVIAEVKAAGYMGSTTVVPGWASSSEDPYRLPRLRVLGGTSPQELLSQIETARNSSTPPPSYAGAGSA